MEKTVHNPLTATFISQIISFALKTIVVLITLNDLIEVDSIILKNPMFNYTIDGFLRYEPSIPLNLKVETNESGMTKP